MLKKRSWVLAHMELPSTATAEFGVGPEGCEPIYSKRFIKCSDKIADVW